MCSFLFTVRSQFTDTKQKYQYNYSNSNKVEFVSHILTIIECFWGFFLLKFCCFKWIHNINKFLEYFFHYFISQFLILAALVFYSNGLLGPD